MFNPFDILKGKFENKELPQKDDAGQSQEPITPAQPPEPSLSHDGAQSHPTGH